jgi:hypothetical protein
VDDLDLLVLLMLVGTLLPYALIILLWMLYLNTKNRLSKITSVQEFKAKMHRLKNIDFKGTKEDILLQLRQQEIESRRRFNTLFTINAILLFVGIILGLLEDLVQYYAHVRTQYVIPIEFPSYEAGMLIALSLWGCFFSLRIFFSKRYALSFDKLSQLETRDQT